MEYIEREALLRHLNDIWLTATPTDAMPDDDRQLAIVRCMGLDDAMDAVKDAPAADVVPVRHGRWVVSRTDYSWNSAEFPTHCKCDQCGREIPYLDRDAYCPTCGAKMDKDGDGDV